jgi:hypothetical protein
VGNNFYYHSSPREFTHFQIANEAKTGIDFYDLPSARVAVIPGDGEVIGTRAHETEGVVELRSRPFRVTLRNNWKERTGDTVRNL